MIQFANQFSLSISDCFASLGCAHNDHGIIKTASLNLTKNNFNGNSQLLTSNLERHYFKNE